MNKRVDALIKRADAVFPSIGTQTASKSYKMWVHGGKFDFPGFAIREKGCIMECSNGKKYINFMGHLGAGILDADDRDVQRAIRKQLKNGIIFSLPSEIEVELGELMCEVVPNCEMVRFCKNGSDATSCAIRIARSYTKKDFILMPKTGYAGWSDQFCAVSVRDYGMPNAFKSFVDFFDYNNAGQLENLLKTGRYAAIIMEPVSTDEPKKGYLLQVRELCTKYGVILIFDEMITGFRFALGGCQELFGINADLMCFGKAMSNGTSISCVAGKKKYMNELDKVFFSATYFGECLSIAGCIANIKKLRDNKDIIYPHIWKQGNRFKAAFDNKCKELGIDAQTIGMAPRINLRFNYADAIGLRDLYHQEMLRRGIFIGVQIYATWATKEKHLNRIIEASDKSLEIVKEALLKGNIDRFLEGKRSEQIFKR